MARWIDSLLVDESPNPRRTKSINHSSASQLPGARPHRSVGVRFCHNGCRGSVHGIDLIYTIDTCLYYHLACAASFHLPSPSTDKKIESATICKGAPLPNLLSYRTNHCTRHLLPSAGALPLPPSPPFLRYCNRPFSVARNARMSHSICIVRHQIRQRASKCPLRTQVVLLSPRYERSTAAAPGIEASSSSQFAQRGNVCAYTSDTCKHISGVLCVVSHECH